MKRVTSWIVVAIVAAASGAAAFVATQRLEPLFEVASRLAVAPGDDLVADDALELRVDGADHATAAATVEVLQRALVILGVADPSQRDVRELRTRTGATLVNEPTGRVLVLVARGPSPEVAGARVRALTEATRAWDRQIVDAHRASRIERLDVRLNELSEQVRTLQTFGGAGAAAQIEEIVAARVVLEAQREDVAAALGTEGLLIVLDAGLQHARAVGPPPILNAAAAALVTLVAGYLLGSRPRRRRLIHRRGGVTVAGLPLLASFPAWGSKDPPRLRTAASELMTSVVLATEGVDHRVILVTSSGPSEGKSTVAALLAEALASHGYLTLLVDGDLHMPSLAERFGFVGRPPLPLDRPTAEAAAALGPEQVSTASEWFRDPMGGHRVERINLGGERHLRVVPQFAAAPLDAVTLSKGIDGALRQWAGYDVVVIDAASVSVAHDGAIMGRHCTGMVLVADQERSGAGRLRAAARAMRRRGGLVLGVVWTNAREEDQGDHVRGPEIVSVPVAPSTSSALGQRDAEAARRTRG